MSLIKFYNVAVVGATGAVGEAMLSILEERKFPIGEIHALASSKSVGKRIPFNGGSLKVEDLASFDFSRTQIALFSAGGSVSAEYAPKRRRQVVLWLIILHIFAMRTTSPWLCRKSIQKKSQSTKTVALSPTLIAQPSRWWWP